MSMEDKDLMLVDFCARLPYGQTIKVKFGVMGMPQPLAARIASQVTYVKAKTIENMMYGMKTYLRPMNQMTEKEKTEYGQITEEWERVQYLDSHALDHRGLLKKKLAYEAKEGMYNFE